MNHKYCLMIACLLFSIGLFAQLDTTYKYYNKNWKECKEDTAFYIGKIFKEGNLWHRKDYWKSTGRMQMDGFYRDSIAKLQRIGTFSSFDDSGKLYRTLYFNDDSRLLEVKTYYSNGNIFEKIEFNKNSGMYMASHKFDEIEGDKYFLSVNMDSTIKEEHHYFENGKENGYVVFDNNENIVEQKGWDENGKEIPNYIHKQIATFPGGRKAWKEYLEKNLHGDVPSKNRAPYGKYNVVVSFMINKDGDPIDIKALNDPGYGTAQEGIRVVKESGKWQPAIMWGKKVIYRQIQQITFLVEK